VKVENVTRKEDNDWSSKVCPKLHPLRKYRTPVPNYTCDICDAYIPKGKVMYGCKECDWDSCTSCITRLAQDGTYRKNRHALKGKFVHSEEDTSSEE